MAMTKLPRRLEDFGTLTPAEQAAVDGLESGLITVIGDGTLPPRDAGPEPRIRASLVRWLALGAPGEDRIRLQEKGLWLAGALITSDGTRDPFFRDESTPGLDLAGCSVENDLALFDCRFANPVILRDARMQSLHLMRSHVPGLDADRLEARGIVNLRAAEVTGEVKLRGARLDNELTLALARLKNPGGRALNADALEVRVMFLNGAVIEGEVALRQARNRGDLSCDGAVIEGQVSLVHARIGGDLSCIRARMTGSASDDQEVRALTADGSEIRGRMRFDKATILGVVSLISARIGGDLECVDAKFLCVTKLKNRKTYDGTIVADRARISGSLFWRGDELKIEGMLDLSGADIGSIADDPASWPTQGNLALAGYRYGSFTSKLVDAASRLRWLGLQEPGRWGVDFWPQPYEQCAKVLREMGHPEDATRVLIEKEGLQRMHQRPRMPEGWRRRLRAGWDGGCLAKSSAMATGRCARRGISRGSGRCRQSCSASPSTWMP